MVRRAGGRRALVSTFVLLTGEPALPDRPRSGAIGSVLLPRPAPIVATFLASVRLVDVFIGPRGLARVLLGVE